MPKHNSNSSLRQKAASVAHQLVISEKSSRSKKNKDRKERKKKLNQQKRFHPIMPMPNKQYSHQLLNDSIVFVDGGTTGNPTINPIIRPANNPGDKPIVKLSIREGHLHVPTDHLTTPRKGLIYRPEGQPSQVILSPRTFALESTSLDEVSHVYSLLDAFDAIESAIRKTEAVGKPST